MHRVALLAGFVSMGLLAPSTSHACCADVDTTAPIGWSVDGDLLVGRQLATECNGTSLAEVMEPGERVASERYDLYSRSARIGLRTEGRAIDDDTLWEEEEDGASPDRYAPSPALRRRFSIRPTALCGADVLGLAFPTGQRGVDRFDEEVLLSVRVRTEAGFREVLSGVRWQRVTAQTMHVFVHPSPDGTRAFVRFHTDGPEATFDDAHWIDLPADTIRSRDCDLDALRAPVLPSAELENDSYQEDLRWMIESANEQLAARSDEGSPAYFAAEAAWTRPRDPSIRALLVRAIAREFGPELAAAIESEAPLATDEPSIADGESIVDALAGGAGGPSSPKPPLFGDVEAAVHGPLGADAASPLESPQPAGTEPPLELDIDEAVLVDPAYGPDGGVTTPPELTQQVPMACSAASFDAIALLVMLVPLAFRRRR